MQKSSLLSIVEKPNIGCMDISKVQQLRSCKITIKQIESCKILWS